MWWMGWSFKQILMVLTFGLLQLVLADLLGSYVDFEGMHFINTTTQGNWTKKEKKTQRENCLLASKKIMCHLTACSFLMPMYLIPACWAATATSMTGIPTIPNMYSTPCVLSDFATTVAPSISHKLSIWSIYYLI